MPGELAIEYATTAVIASPANIHPYTARRNAVTRSAAPTEVGNVEERSRGSIALVLLARGPAVLASCGAPPRSMFTVARGHGHTGQRIHCLASAAGQHFAGDRGGGQREGAASIDR